jgi:hypothetical protein
MAGVLAVDAVPEVADDEVGMSLSAAALKHTAQWSDVRGFIM